MKFSIITVVRNAEGTIRDTIQSVLSQSHPHIEYIVIDGASEDDTLKVIGDFRGSIDLLLSEPDSGLYDAMNKAISKASGDVIGILNADDIFERKEVLEKVNSLFEKSGALGVYGDLVYVARDDLTSVHRYWKSGIPDRKKFLWGWMPPHPSLFIKKEVFNRFGNYNTSLRSAADYELMLRIIYKHQIKLAYLPEIVTRMRTGGLSNKHWGSRIRANREDRKAWEMNGLTPYFFTTILKPLRKIPQYFQRP